MRDGCAPSCRSCVCLWSFLHAKMKMPPQSLKDGARFPEDGHLPASVLPHEMLQLFFRLPAIHGAGAGMEDFHTLTNEEQGVNQWRCKWEGGVAVLKAGPRARVMRAQGGEVGLLRDFALHYDDT